MPRLAAAVIVRVIACLHLLNTSIFQDSQANNRSDIGRVRCEGNQSTKGTPYPLMLDGISSTHFRSLQDKAVTDRPAKTHASGTVHMQVWSGNHGRRNTDLNEQSIRRLPPLQGLLGLPHNLSYAHVMSLCWCLRLSFQLRERSPVIMRSDDASLDRRSGDCPVRRIVSPRSRLPAAGDSCNCAFSRKANSGEFFGKRKLQCKISHIDAPQFL
jgi:hypothetical protein